LTPINLLLIAANIAIFVYEVRLGGREAGALLADLGMVPARITHPAGGVDASLWAPATLLTSLFLHGGFFHVAGNMLYLFIFGPAVETRMGHARFLAFYLASGVAAGLAMVWMQPDSHLPVIGASGAIAGVLGAYFVLYPRARILTLIPLFIFIELIEVPAVVYLMIWFAVQLYSGLISQVASRAPLGGVAWWAHVGGFLFGIAAAPLLARARRDRFGA
jgi:membrane associated rhomboid family serine protease